MKQFLLITLFAVSTFSHSSAQTFPGGMMGGGTPKIYDGKISGVITDAVNQKAVEFANVALYKMSDSTKAIDGAITDEKGFFKLKDIKNGKYRIGISFIGYLTLNFDSIEITDKKTNIELGKIIFKPKSKVLKEANVEEEAPLIENKIDKIVYNASKDISVKGGNAQDVLRKVPMVTVDLEGNVELRGTQNVKVLINNKPSSIMAATVADAMKMIPADEIEKVEVITSPSAKYDAEGTGGIINIITKKKNIEGLSGSVNVGVGTRTSNLFGSVNYRQGRFGLGVNAGGFGYNGKGNLNSLRTTDNGIVPYYLKQGGDNSTFGAGPYAQMNADYDINSKNSLTASFRLNGMIRKNKGDIDNSVSFDNTNYTPLFTNHSDVKTSRLGYDANLDYKRTFAKTDQEFTLSTQLTNSASNTDYGVYYDTLDHEYYREKSLNESNNREATLQADYVHPFTKKTSLDIGAKTILRDVKSDYRYDTLDYATDVYFPVTSRNNVFDYTQNIYAGYVQGSTTIGRWGFKAGVRFEATEVNGKFENETENPPLNSLYNNLIPTGTISYTKSAKYSLKLSYTQRIQRPSMNYLNPYINQSDPTNISYGNPNLEPEKSHSFEFGHSLFRKFGSINSSVYHRFTNNAIESIRFVDKGIYQTTYANIGENTTTGASIGANIIWKQKLVIGGNFNIYYYTVKSTENDLSNDGINYNINLYGNYKFNKQWGVQLFGNFSGPKYSLQGKSTSFFFYNMSARREFKNEKGGIGLGLDNFFTPYINFKNEYSGDGFTYNSTNKFFFLGVRVSFDYRFGKVSFNNSKKKGIKNDDLKQGGDDGNGMGNMPGGGK
ncbi:MAG: TonB-dependent receptor [Bacteroidia bacterium]